MSKKNGKISNISLNDRGDRVTCLDCGQVWSPNLLPGGRRPRGWCHCPNGCTPRALTVESDEAQEERLAAQAMDVLYDRLIHVEIPDDLMRFEVVDCFMRATCVAAGVPASLEFLLKMLTLLSDEEDHDELD